MILFSRPWAFGLFGAVAAAALLAAAHFRWKARTLRRLGDPDLLRGLSDPSAPRRQRLKAVLSLAALALLVLAAAGPRWGRSYQRVRRRGVDVVIAVDVSASMLAQDVLPDRLTQAKRELGLLIDSLEEDRVGLVAFAGAAFLQCPLTLDHAAAGSLLELVGPDLVPRPGTDLAAALETSLAAFPPADARHKAVILLTDGEDHSGRLDAAVKRAEEEGARIFPVGFGSPSGEVIPVRDENGNMTDYKKDKNGKTVVSKLDEAALQNMASRTGGTYRRASDGEVDLEGLQNDVGRMEKKTLEDRVADRTRNRAALPLAAALAIAFLEFLWPERRGHFKELWGRWAKRSAAILLLAPAFPPGGHAMGRKPDGEPRAVRYWRERAEKDPRDAASRWNLGQAMFQNGDAAGAASAFEESGKMFPDPVRRSQAAYNAGTALAKSGKSEEALERFKESMRLAPDDADAKHNYELVRRQMKKGGGKGKPKPDKGKAGEQKSGEQPASAAQTKESLSKEDAERILQAVERQEKEARRKDKMPPPHSTTGEDW